MRSYELWVLVTGGIAFWVGAAVLVLFTVASRLAFVQSFAMSRLSKRVGLGIPPALDSTIRARVAGRMLWGSVGALAGLAVGSVLVVATHASFTTPLLYGVVGVASVGEAIGNVGATFRRELAVDPRPRIARLQEVTLGSYVAPVVRVLAWLQLAIAVGAVLLFAGSSTVHRGLLVAMVAVLALNLLSLTALEVLGRRLVRRGQPATSTDELVWNDALRATSFRTVVTAPQLCLALVCVVPALWASSTAVDPWAFIPLVLFFASALLMRGMVRELDTWYLTELWPGARRRTREESETLGATTA